MPLIELKCNKCGYESEELLKADGKYPACPECGNKLGQKYNGKLYAAAKSGCGGNCGSCGGCGGREDR